MSFLLFTLISISPKVEIYHFPHPNTDSFLVFYKIPSEFVYFQKEDDLYRGTVILSYSILNKRGNQISGNIKSLVFTVPSSQTDTIFKGKLNFTYSLKEGKVLVFLRSKSLEFKKEKKISSDKLSDILLFDPEKEQELIEVETQPKIGVYLEVLPSDDAFLYIKLLKGKKEITRKTKKIKRNGIIPVREVFDLSSLTGNLVFHIKFENEEKKLSFSRTGFSLMKDADYKDLLDALTYFFPREDIESLRDVPVEERRKKWDEFWEKRNPAPGSPYNELKEVFLERFEYANRNFGVFNPGYKTDRGRTYILYGEPDEIERHPFEWDSYPYEIWYYYSLRRKFIFVDKLGFGEYELVPYLSSEYLRPR